MENNSLLQDFTCDEHEQRWWGNVYMPFWGSTIRTALYMDANKQANPRGVEMLQAMVSYRGDFRESFIQAAFDWYTEEVYGAFSALDGAGNDITHIIAPLVTEPSQIWPMLSEPEINIHSYDKEHKVCFGISFKSQWDREHGFGMQYKDWEIVWVGAAGDVW